MLLEFISKLLKISNILCLQLVRRAWRRSRSLSVSVWRASCWPQPIWKRTPTPAWLALRGGFSCSKHTSRPSDAGTPANTTKILTTTIKSGFIFNDIVVCCVYCRFAYHLRQWQIEGTGISSHLKALSDKQSLPLRIVCQPAGLPDKVGYHTTSLLLGKL